MLGPPPEVLTGVLRGGPCDGLVVEIDEGASTLQLGALGGSGLSEDMTYRYGGEIDGDGNAVFVHS